MGIIYRLTFPNNKIYIGLTMFNIEKRFNEHCRDANNGSECPIHNAIRKYGKDNIKKEIIDSAETMEELKKLEIKHISICNSLVINGKGYNQTIGGDGTNGYKFNDTQRQNASNAQKKRVIENPDCFIKVSKGNILYNKLHPEKAQTHSEYMTERLKNPKLREEHSDKLKLLYEKEPNRKIKMSKIKIKQYEENPDIKQKISDSVKDRLDKHPEIRQKISDSVKDNWTTQEYRNKIIDKKRERFLHNSFYAINIINNETFKNEEGNIILFTYIPDCGNAVFNEPKKYNSNIGSCLKGKRNVCNGYTFKYFE